MANDIVHQYKIFGPVKDRSELIKEFKDEWCIHWYKKPYQETLEEYPDITRDISTLDGDTIKFYERRDLYGGELFRDLIKKYPRLFVKYLVTDDASLVDVGFYFQGTLVYARYVNIFLDDFDAIADDVVQEFKGTNDIEVNIRRTLIREGGQR